MTREQSDPVIDEVREVRCRISARFDNDPARLVAYYMKQQERHRERLIDPVKATEPTDPVGRLTSRCSGACPPCLYMVS